DMLSADRSDAFGRLVVGAEISLVPLANGLLELGGTARGRVLGEILIEGANRRLLDIVGGGGIGLACAEVDHIHSLRAQLFRIRRHLHRGRHADRRDPFRYFQLSCHTPFRFRSRASTGGGTSPEIFAPKPKTSFTRREL